MRKIAIVGFKGGIGKTTTCVNLGAALAMRGYRVLLIDTDTQANLSIALGITNYKLSLTEVLWRKVEAKECVVPARNPNPQENPTEMERRNIELFPNWTYKCSIRRF